MTKAASQFLSAKQDQFVVEYIGNGGNGRRAAIAAGYSAKSASSAAASNLKSQRVIAAMAKCRADLAERSDLTLDRIEKMHMAAYDLAKEQGKPGDMNRATESLGKMQGAYIDRIEDGRETVIERFTRLATDLSSKAKPVLERDPEAAAEAKQIMGVITARLKNSDSEGE